MNCGGKMQLQHAGSSKRLLSRLVVRLLSSNLVAIAAAAIAVGPALATHFGSGIDNPCDDTPASQCIADNWTHTVYIGYLGSTASMRAPTSSAVAHINLARDVSVVLTVSSSRDVNAIQASHGSTEYWAYSACDEAAAHGGTDPNEWCRPQWIVYNMTHPVNWDGTATGRNTVACHELGHTLGLRDRASGSSCMRDAVTTPPNLETHDWNELNTHYLPY